MITLLFFSFLSATSAQDSIIYVQDKVTLEKELEVISNENSVMKAFTDSLNNLRASFYAHFRVWEDLNIPTPRKLRPNSDFYKLIVPPTYYHAPVKQAFEIDWEPGKKLVMSPIDSLLMAKADTIPSFEVPQIGRSVAADRWVNRQLLQYYMQYPDRVKGNEMFLEGMKAYNESHLPDANKKEDLKTYMKNDGPTGGNVQSETELVVVKPNFWKKSGKASLQFSQHGISDNWYQGGESTNALLGELKLTANYDDHQRIQFDNSLEIKIGFITAPSDTVHSYKTNADLFRLNSKLGVRAIKNLYYTLAAEFKTQFFPNYKTNTNDLISAFLSPAQLDLSLGLDYKLSGKKYNLSLMGSPFSYTFVYIDNDKIINPSSFNVVAGEKTANLFGSKIKANFDWKILSNITYSSVFDYFTTYDTVIASWENTFNFQVSRYLSAKIFLHARFDDGVKLTEENDSYFQFKEMLTFGLSYTW